MGLCIGSEFSVGARGELLLAGRREQAWPYPLCDLAEANGIRVDPDRGLWTPERAVFPVEGGEYLGTDVNLGATAYTPNPPPAPVEIVNTSRCQSLLVWGSVRVDWGIDLDPGSVVSVRSGHRVGGPVETFASYMTQATDGEPRWTWHARWVEPVTAVIPPETTGKLYVNSRFQMLRGAGVLTYMGTRVAGAAITV